MDSRGVASSGLPQSTQNAMDARQKQRVKSRAIIVWIGYLTLFLLAIPVLQWLSVPHVPVLHQFIAFIVLFLCLVPTALHITAGRGLPFFPTICLVYASGYSLPVFFVAPVVVAMSTRTGYITVNTASVTQALWLTCLGVLMMQAGFWFFRFSLLHLMVPRVKLALKRASAQRLMMVAGVLGLTLMWSSVTGRVLFQLKFLYLSVLVMKLAALAIALLYYYFLNNELTKRMKWCFFGLTGAYALIGLASGNLRQVIDPVVIIAAVNWMVKRQFPWKLAVLAVAVFLIIQPIKAAYRIKVWGEGYGSHSLTQRLTLWFDLMKMSLTGEKIPGLAVEALTTRKTLLRTDLIHTFARVIELTPRRVPFQLGSTYSYLMYSLVPRALWPGKPTGQAVNQFFGVAYDFQTPDSVKDTSIGCPHLPEAYLNFGSLGVVFVMLIIGMIYGAIEELFNHPNAGEGGIAAYAVLLTDLWTIESATAPTFGGIIQGILLYTLVLRVVRQKETKYAAPHIQKREAA